MSWETVNGIIMVRCREIHLCDHYCHMPWETRKEIFLFRCHERLSMGSLWSYVMRDPSMWSLWSYAMRDYEGDLCGQMSWEIVNEITGQVQWETGNEIIMVRCHDRLEGSSPIILIHKKFWRIWIEIYQCNQKRNINFKLSLIFIYEVFSYEHANFNSFKYQSWTFASVVYSQLKINALLFLVTLVQHSISNKKWQKLTWYWFYIASCIFTTMNTSGK